MTDNIYNAGLIKNQNVIDAVEFKDKLKARNSICLAYLYRAVNYKARLSVTLESERANLHNQ